MLIQYAKRYANWLNTGLILNAIKTIYR